MRRLADTREDERFMRLALRLARRGEGRVEPNPMVGCVLVRHGRVVGQGWHRRFGGPHAEVFALRQAGPAARGATAYVTLEPCNIFGKTPPCTDALIEAGIRCVVAATTDPNPQIDGAGLRHLRRAGVQVVRGLCADEADELIAPFRTLMRLARPYVIAKWAQSLDGRMAAAGGESKWISGPLARREVHRLRARVDAILVGIGTVLADDPQLTARQVPVRRLAARVVLDSGLRLPLRSRLVRTAREAPVIVFTLAKQLRTRRADRLRAAGVELQAAPARRGRLRIDAVLSELARRACTNVLVEGGAELLASFLQDDKVDEARVYVAPMFLGGAGAAGPTDRLYVPRLADAKRPRRIEIHRSGAELSWRLRF